MTKIGHAVSDENGTNGKTGAQIGDQTGKEIASRDWYVSGSGWLYLLICMDQAMANRAAAFMEEIIWDPNFGYSQEAKQRWSGLKSILANGGKVAGARGDFDCSTLCIACYILAGLDHAARGSTHSMYKSLMATGKFIAYKDAEHLASGDYAQRGALYLRKGHVAMALTDGPKAGMVAAASEADSINPPYVEILGSVHVRSGPSKQYESLFIAKEGQRYVFGDVDPDTGWYGIEFPDGMGFVSNRADLTRLVTK